MSVTPPLFQSSFWFLRHGETETNRLGLVAGATDVALNETGWQQARAAAASLAGRGIGAIYSSPLRRARDTAGCVADALGLPVSIVPELAERHWGELEGKPRGLRVREATPPGGEGLQAFADRTLRGLMQIPAAPTPLIVAHSGTFRVLCRLLNIAQGAAPVGNSLPLCLIPPASLHAAWTIGTT
jgi:probable phosphoglycerate mutase